MRVLVFLDYSFFISKLNLNFALDSAINAIWILNQRLRLVLKNLK